MSDISLSRGIRQNLLSLQRTADLQAQTQNRLATGRKVNSALDDPANFFVSEGLEARASDLSRLLDSMGLGVKTLEAADAGIAGLKKLVETAQGLARQARQTADAPTRLSLAAQFDVIRTQIDQLAGDSAYNGVNLIGATPDNLMVVFNETNATSLTITGVSRSARRGSASPLRQTTGRPTPTSTPRSPISTPGQQSCARRPRPSART